jgi:hypothetical protein
MQGGGIWRLKPIVSIVAGKITTQRQRNILVDRFASTLVIKR